MSDLQTNLISNVRLLMRLYDVSQEGLAKILDLAQPQVSRRLRQKIKWTVDDLEKVSARFNVGVMMLFETVPVMLRSLADHVEATGVCPWDIDLIVLPEQAGRTSTCVGHNGSSAPRLFDPRISAVSGIGILFAVGVIILMWELLKDIFKS